MEKIKKAFITFGVMAMIAVAGAIPALADDPADISTVMSDGMTSMKGDVLRLIAVVIPVGLGIFAIFFGVRKAISMLRSTTGG